MRHFSAMSLATTDTVGNMSPTAVFPGLDPKSVELDEAPALLGQVLEPE
jgi:hypothetical protein